MLRVGITGSIGSGKSTICSAFSLLLGVPVFSADDEAKIVFVNSTVEIKKEFGTYDPKELSSIVFRDKVKLEKLNSIIHPGVRARFEEWVKEYADHKYVLMEAAILFESGADKFVDKIITVTAPVETRIARVMKRNSISREAVLDRMRNQMSDEDKIKRSDYVIINNDGPPPMRKIRKIHNELIGI